jgi:hypothetical protein
MSLLVMICGFTVMILKPNNITLEEPCFASPQESMTGMLVTESNAVYFLIIEALCCMNSLLMVRQSRFLSGSSETSVGCCTKKAT